MSHHPSSYINHHLPHVDHCPLYMNENNGHQPYLIQNPPVNINMPTTPTVMLPNAVPQMHPASNPTIHQPQHNIHQPPQGHQYVLGYPPSPIMMSANIQFHSTGQYSPYYPPPLYGSPQNVPIKNVINPIPGAHHTHHFHQPGLVVPSPPDVTRSSINQTKTQHSKIKRPNALTNIVDPKTGRNVAEDIYQHANEDSTDKIPHPEDLQIAADFASRVARVATSPEPRTTTTVPVSSSQSDSLNNHPKTCSPKNSQHTSQLSQPQYTISSNSFQTTVSQSHPSSTPTQNISHQRSDLQNDQFNISTNSNRHVVPPPNYSQNINTNSQPHGSTTASTQYHVLSIDHQQIPATTNCHSSVSPSKYQQPNYTSSQHNSSVSHHPIIIVSNSNQQNAPQVHYQQTTAINYQQNNLPSSNQAIISTSQHGAPSVNYQPIIATSSHSYCVASNNYQPPITTNSQQRNFSSSNEQLIYTNTNDPINTSSNQNHPSPSNQQQSNYNTMPSQYHLPPNNSQQTMTTSSHQSVISHSNQHNTNLQSQIISSQSRYQHNISQDNCRSVTASQITSTNYQHNTPLNISQSNVPPANFQPIPVQNNFQVNIQQNNHSQNNHGRSIIPNSYPNINSQNNKQNSNTQRNNQNTSLTSHNQNKRNGSYNKPPNNSNRIIHTGRAANIGQLTAPVSLQATTTTILKHTVTSEVETKSDSKEESKLHPLGREDIKHQHPHSNIVPVIITHLPRPCYSNMLQYGPPPQQPRLDYRHQYHPRHQRPSNYPMRHPITRGPSHPRNLEGISKELHAQPNIPIVKSTSPSTVDSTISQKALKCKISVEKPINRLAKRGGENDKQTSSSSLSIVSEVENISETVADVELSNKLSHEVGQQKDSEKFKTISESPQKLSQCSDNKQQSRKSSPVNILAVTAKPSIKLEESKPSVESVKESNSFVESEKESISSLESVKESNSFVKSEKESKSYLELEKESKSSLESKEESKSPIESEKESKSIVNSEKESKSFVNLEKESKSSVKSKKGSKSSVKSEKESKSSVKSEKESKSSVKSKKELEASKQKKQLEQRSKKTPVTDVPTSSLPGKNEKKKKKTAPSAVVDISTGLAAVKVITDCAKSYKKSLENPHQKRQTVIKYKQEKLSSANISTPQSSCDTPAIESNKDVNDNNVLEKKPIIKETSIVPPATQQENESNNQKSQKISVPSTCDLIKSRTSTIAVIQNNSKHINKDLDESGESTSSQEKSDEEVEHTSTKVLYSSVLSGLKLKNKPPQLLDYLRIKRAQNNICSPTEKSSKSLQLPSNLNQQQQSSSQQNAEEKLGTVKSKKEEKIKNKYQDWDDNQNCVKKYTVSNTDRFSTESNQSELHQQSSLIISKVSPTKNHELLLDENQKATLNNNQEVNSDSPQQEPLDNIYQVTSDNTKKVLVDNNLEVPLDDIEQISVVQTQELSSKTQDVSIDGSQQILPDNTQQLSLDKVETEVIISDVERESREQHVLESFSLETFTFLNPSVFDNVDEDATTSSIVTDTAEIVTEVVVNPQITDEKNQSTSIVKDNSQTAIITKEVTLGDKDIEMPNIIDPIIDQTEEMDKLVLEKNEKNIQLSNNQLESSQDVVVHILPLDVSSDNTQNKIWVKKDLIKKNETTPLKEASSELNAKDALKKNQYSREFLMSLKNSSLSQIRPANLPDMDVVKTRPKQNIRDSTPVNTRAFPEPSFKPPEYFFPGSSRSFNSRVALPSRKSMPGNKSRSTEPQIIHVKLSRSEDVELHTAKNAWKPSVSKKNTPVSDKDEKTQLLYKKVRSVLNKLTPEKFDKLVGQVRELEIDTQEKLQGVINLVFDKAIDEPNFAKAYVMMCSELALMKVDVSTDEIISQGAKTKEVDFRRLLIIRCQTEFEKTAVDEATREEKVEEIENCTDTTKKKELQLSLEENDYLTRRRSVGINKFIGELFKKKMLTKNIMQQCILQLLRIPDEENLECLCKLLTTIGQMYEEDTSLSEYFKILENLITQQEKNKISSRIRFMIQDVIDLRRNGWRPRRNDSNPKTMDQIKRDVEEERLNTNILLNTPKDIRRNDRITPPSSYRGDDRFTPQETNRRDYSTDRRRNRSNIKPDSEGWSPSKYKNKSRLSVETAKLIQKPSTDDQLLGNRNVYKWTPSTPSYHTPTVTSNPYSLLDTPNVSFDHDRRSASIAGSRSAGPKDYRTNINSNSSWGGRNSQNNRNQTTGSSLRRESLSLNKVYSPSIQNLPINTFQPDFKVPNSISALPLSRSSSTSSVASNKSRSRKTQDELEKVFKKLLKRCNDLNSTEEFIVDAQETLNENFDSSSFPFFIQQTIDAGLERTSIVRRRYSSLLSHMIEKKMVTLSLFQAEYEKFIEIADELVIDVPLCWEYFAEMLSEMLVSGTHPFTELKQTLSVLKNTGNCGKLLGALLSMLGKSKGFEWVIDKWDKSGLMWSDLVDTQLEAIDDIIKKYKLDSFNDRYNNCPNLSSANELNFNEIQSHLEKLMRENKFDDAVSWISVNVGEKSKYTQFIRSLVTVVLKVSIEPHGQYCKLNEETFSRLLPYIRRYVDADPLLELHCLYAIQLYIDELEYPQGVLAHIIEILDAESIIAEESFLSWQKSTDPAQMQGHAVAITTLASFFRCLLRNSNDDSEY
ncbi:uncharacterized protein LOC130667298 [Microplitis mediator]|uniref:uncharacterized protein LOC130667298 n=1 Tax=Microplitis mediator TaxID=375433 RepID=UPI002555A940|nr:uncharacterized protein LOC130667298 [Microplitis mediator]